MTDNVTRCPKCATSFRISDAHLNSAKGSVRCGSCLSVFNAKNHLIPSHDEAPTPPQPEETAQEDDILISDTMDMPKQETSEMDEFRDEFSGVMFAKGDTGEHDFNLFERDTIQDDDDDDVPQDESWALDLLNDDPKDSELPEQPSEDTGEHEPRQKTVYDTQESESLSEEGYYNNSFQIIEETPSPSIGNVAKELYDEYDDVEIEEFDYSETAQTYAQPTSHHDDYAAGNSSDYLSSIEPEPVEFDYHGHSQFWHSRTLWASLSLVAGLLLVVQFAWIKFPSLSVIEPYRSYYAQACNVFSCQLPELIDRSKIRSANLVVRSHPKVRNALVVDAVIQNTAKFEQTFPTLDLIFTDNLDKVVSARRLSPKEYLGGELAGRANMPRLQPVHIAIEIADPGEDAVGYQIIIVN
ncbi:MAG: zinc-ribbon and DUF3426 domain-containing protein [Agarilytica sp.]